MHGRNVYAIMRAKRTQNTEAIVLSTPYRPDMGGNLYGAATMLSLAKYFKSKSRMQYKKCIYSCGLFIQYNYTVELPEQH